LQSLSLGAVETPEKASLETFVERIDNQLSKPWCVAFGVCNAVEFAMKMRGVKVPDGGLSKAYLYARCKQLDGIPNNDGTYIRTALDIATKEGICPDYLCPTAKYLNESALPTLTAAIKTEAAKYKIKAYARLQDAQGYADLGQIKQALANKQFVVIGSWVEQANWLDGDDLITVPKGTLLGGHCTYVFGYDNAFARVGLTGFCDDANSWGESWGDRGKCHMSYDYVNFRYLDGIPTLSEAWTFTVDGTMPTMKTYDMPVPMQIIQTPAGGNTMLPFRAIYEALGAAVRYYTNSAGKLVVVAEVELKSKTVIVEATQDDATLRTYERA